MSQQTSRTLKKEREVQLCTSFSHIITSKSINKILSLTRSTSINRWQRSQLSDYSDVEFQENLKIPSWTSYWHAEYEITNLKKQQLQQFYWAPLWWLQRNPLVVASPNHTWMAWRRTSSTFPDLLPNEILNEIPVGLIFVNLREQEINITTLYTSNLFLFGLFLFFSRMDECWFWKYGFPIVSSNSFPSSQIWICNSTIWEYYWFKQ